MMQTIALMGPLKETVAGWGWPLLWIIFILSLIWAFSDHRQLRSKLNSAAGLKKKALTRKLALLWAIPLITFIAGVSAYWETEITEHKILDADSKTMAISNSLVEAKAKLDPLNQPVTTMEAFVRLDFPLGTRMTGESSMRDAATINFMHGFEDENVKSVSLLAEKFKTWDGHVLLDCRWDTVLRHLAGTNMHQTVGQLLNEVSCFGLNAYCVPADTRISGGLISLTLNSSFTKTFLIPPQTAGKWGRIQGQISQLSGQSVDHITTSTMPLPSAIK